MSKAPSQQQFDFIHGVVRTARGFEVLQKKDFLEWFAVVWDAHEEQERRASQPNERQP